MVEVFKTDIEDPNDTRRLKDQIAAAFPDCSISFDLEDCDRILRIASPGMTIDAQKVTGILSESGFYCCVLEETAG